MKSNSLIKFTVPIILGILIGFTAKFLNTDIPIRLLLTVSDNILVILKYLTPFLLLTLSTVSFFNIKENKKNKLFFILKLFGIICISLTFLGFFVLFIALTIVPLISFPINSETSVWLDPYFKIPILQIFYGNLNFLNSLIPLLAIVSGMFIGLISSKQNKVIKFFEEILSFIFNFLKTIINPLMPIWITSSFALTSFTSNLNSLIITDLLLSWLILFLQFSWLFFMYFLVSQLFKVNFKKLTKNALKVYGLVFSLGGKGTEAVFPFIIKKQEDLGYNKEKSTLITVTSFNMPGSLISNIIFISGISYMFNFQIDISSFIYFIFILILATIAAPSIPGGVSAITSSLAISILGFSDEMIQLFMSMYYKQGTSNSATNNAADFYLSAFFKKKNITKNKKNF